MSSTPNTPALVGGSQLSIPAKFEAKLAELDAFSEQNSLALLTDGKGGFTAAIGMATAMNQLRAMLTDDVMEPIMSLQSSALGFKTDKDKDPPSQRYPVEVVRDVLIEATLKGFRMVGNQSNIIAGRFYATKEGFEDWMLRESRKGHLTQFQDAYSVPKYISDQEAHVNISASWTYKNKMDQFKDVSIAIRINKGQGADAILGKAKRKLLARIYSRLTGLVIAEGEAGEAIDVQATPVSETSGGGASTTPRGPAPATEEQITKLTEIIGEHEEKANAFLRQANKIPPTGTYRNLMHKGAQSIIDRPKEFLAAIGATNTKA